MLHAAPPDGPSGVRAFVDDLPSRRYVPPAVGVLAGFDNHGNRNARVTTPVRLAVFVSGGGTNLQALLDHFNARESSIARVELVVASRAGIGALDRAARAGVATAVIDASAPAATAEAAMLEALAAARIDAIALAGYVRLVPSSVVNRFAGRMVNIHPALLPSFGGAGMYGARVHQAVIASGARVSGATVHLVDDRFDEGRIIAQWPVPVLSDDTPERLAERVLKAEHLLYPVAIEALFGVASRPSDAPLETFDLTAADAPAIESVRRLNS